MSTDTPIEQLPADHFDPPPAPAPNSNPADEPTEPEYTPTTDQVRNNMALGVAFAATCETAAADIDWPTPGFRPAAKADFDRWLAQHDAAVKANALRDYATTRYLPYLQDPTIPWPQQPSQLAKQYAKAIEELRAEADRIHPTSASEDS